ncbi:heparan-alpha-glucosaminide N-acetyltransferase [Thermodesulfobacteriota bacterium]
MQKQGTGTEKNAQGPRYPFIDFLRGLGSFLMIIFHLVFDLNFFRVAKITFLNNLYWIGFGRLILALFLICVGIGLALVHKHGIRWNLLKKRFYKIGGWALVITAVTYMILPKNFVFFGILHCISLSSVIGVFFVTRPKLSLLLGVLLLVSDIVFKPTILPLSELLGVIPADYIPLYPWFGLVLLGIYLESVGFHKMPIKSNICTRPFEAMGRHSLKIYLLHQPVLFGVLFILNRFIL